MSKKRKRSAVEEKGTPTKVTVHVVNPPRYVLDLDLPPSQRWDRIVDDFKGSYLF